MNIINSESLNNVASDALFFRKIKFLLMTLVLLLSLALGWYILIDPPGSEITLNLDMEDLDVKGRPINPSTQSLNRYSSVLQNLNRLTSIEVNEQTNTLSFVISDKTARKKLFVNNIQASLLIPLLPYPLTQPLDTFDYANLMLGEYARNGIELSYQDNNQLFGYFNATENLFGKGSEDQFDYSEESLKPNPTIKPLRFNVTNNCLKPGLWEFSATDSVGEMYHSWFKFPKDQYFSLIRTINKIELSNWELSKALRYKRDIKDTPLMLERLRQEKDLLLSEKVRLIASKAIGSYSTQDSRRKAQQKYFQVKRQGAEIEANYFSDLQDGDIFSLRKFVPPGIYSANKKEEIFFNPYWSKMDIREVIPLTQYPGGKTVSQEEKGKLSYIEITLYEKGENKAIVMGNIPISLLVPQEDYLIPSFGAGPFLASEFIERRYIRLKEGPVPHYAYQIEKIDGNWFLVNNHEEGIEQLILRPFIKNDTMHLRITLVSYERIVDLLDLEAPIHGPLKQALLQAGNNYKPPLYRVYEDKNVI